MAKAIDAEIRRNAGLIADTIMEEPVAMTDDDEEEGVAASNI